MKRLPVDMVVSWRPERAIDFREIATDLADLASVSAFVTTLAAIAILFA